MEGIEINEFWTYYSINIFWKELNAWRHYPSVQQISWEIYVCWSRTSIDRRSDSSLQMSRYQVHGCRSGAVLHTSRDWLHLWPFLKCTNALMACLTGTSQQNQRPAVLLSISQSSYAVKNPRTRDGEACSRPSCQVTHGLGCIAGWLLISHANVFNAFLLGCNGNLNAAVLPKKSYSLIL